MFRDLISKRNLIFLSIKNMNFIIFFLLFFVKKKVNKIKTLEDKFDQLHFHHTLQLSAKPTKTQLIDNRLIAF